jgi:uncharacterized protein (DUF362 family)
MHSESKKLSRRDFLKLTTTGLAGVLLGGSVAPFLSRILQPSANVTIFKETSYNGNLADTLRRGIRNYPNVLQKVKGGRVLLKPNLVDYDPLRPFVDTNPAMVAAAITAFRQLGAREVIVGEGPGNSRDTEMLIEKTGLADALRDDKIRFVDLNIDAISPVNLRSNYTGLSQLFFPHTVLNADLIVSMPKAKTHHWAGVTLSLKNFYGAIPGIKYGWPKNFLHWHGIDNCIADIVTTLQPGFAIVDGIVGMEGDGPLNGSAINSGFIVLGDNLTAVDATATRLMGLYPEQVSYMLLMLRYGGTIHKSRIHMLGEPLETMQTQFQPAPNTIEVKDPPSLLRWAISGS